jgi:predicted NAD/FAD-binding protein
MRTFSGGYYANLFQVLKFLGIYTQVRHFRYIFMERTRRHFQFYSNFHRIIPCFENGILINIFNLLCYLWFTIAIFLLPPRITNLQHTRSRTESLDEYARRIWLPSRFLDHYLLPLFASVATCTHDHLRNLPAAYIADYRKLTLGAHHRTVSDMRHLQQRLVKGTRQNLQCEVVSVRSENGDVAVRYRYVYERPEEAVIHVATFDHAILAVSAAQASQIHVASSAVTSRLSSCRVRVAVSKQSREENISQRRSWPSEILMLRTHSHSSIGMVTQSTHLHPSSVAVTVSPCPGNEAEDNHTLHVVDLVRPVPTPDSHDLLLRVFGKGCHSSIWRNGKDNVYLVGGYASAGLPLLEACVRSAFEAAEAIGARLPFPIIRRSPF